MPKKFRKPYLYEVTKDIPKRSKAKWPKCVVCRLEIKGLKVRVAEGEYVCFRCYNE